MIQVMDRLPPLWAIDTLTAYLEQGHKNAHATFWNKREAVGKFMAIDALALAIGGDWKDPSFPLEAIMFFRAHSNFRVAATLTMSGAVYESFIVARSCLETAAYALHMNTSSDAMKVREAWLKRGDGEVEKKAVRTEFTAANVKKSLVAKDAALATVYDTLYDRAIDFGAHPNEGGVSASTKMEKTPDQTKMLQIFLHGDGIPLEFALKNTAQVGICALKIFGHIFQPRYDTLGAFDKIKELEVGL